MPRFIDNTRTLQLLSLSLLAVCFLHSFMNPAHEKRTREIVHEVFPDVVVSLSSEVQPEFREYERLSTTVLNAYLQPVMGQYLRTLEDGIAARADRYSLHQLAGTPDCQTALTSDQ